MLQKTSRRTSARETHKRPAANQAFKECLDKFKSRFPHVSPDAFTSLDRIACDARATEAWSLIASHPEKANIFFFRIVDLFWKSEKGVRTRRLGEFLNDIEDAISACRFLDSFCRERSLSFTSPLRAQAAEPIIDELRRIKRDLETEQQFVTDVLVVDVDHEFSVVAHLDEARRLRSKPGAVFMAALSIATQEIFGRPHDEVVAAVASTLLDADIDPLAVKKARSRARQRKSWNRSFYNRD